MPQQKRIREGTLSKGRIEALADGIFAVAMTILVLDIRAPSYSVRLDRKAFDAFVEGLGDPLMNYLISFLLLSLFWIWHHRQSTRIRRTDPVHLAINLLFLAAVCLVPFSTSTLSRFMDILEADLIFHLNIFVLGSLMMANWWYATSGNRLVDSDIDPERVRSGKRRSMVAPVLAVLGMVASFFIMGNSTIIYILTPFLTWMAGKGLSRPRQEGEGNWD